MDAIDIIKNKVIKDFEELLMKLNKGYTEVCYQNILLMISFILNSSNIEKINTIYEKLINS